MASRCLTALSGPAQCRPDEFRNGAMARHQNYQLHAAAAEPLPLKLRNLSRLFSRLTPAPAPYRSRRTKIAATTTAVVLPIAAMCAFWVFAMMPSTRAESQIVDFRSKAHQWCRHLGCRPDHNRGHELPGDPKRRFYFAAISRIGRGSGNLQGRPQGTHDRYSRFIPRPKLRSYPASYNSMAKSLISEESATESQSRSRLHRLNWGPTLPWGQ